MSELAYLNRHKGKYVVVEISCPACGKGAATKWRHTSCNHIIEINEFGFVRCRMNHGYPFFDWKWRCKYNQGQYLQADPEFLASSLQCLLKGIADAETLNWYLKLVANVGQQFNEEEGKQKKVPKRYRAPGHYYRKY